MKHTKSNDYLVKISQFTPCPIFLVLGLCNINAAYLSEIRIIGGLGIGYTKPKTQYTKPQTVGQIPRCAWDLTHKGNWKYLFYFEIWSFISLRVTFIFKKEMRDNFQINSLCFTSILQNRDVNYHLSKQTEQEATDPCCQLH